MTRYPAVQLFRDRALAVQPAFRITDANAPAVAQVCVRLDGIPLALELAAAALRVLSVEQLLGRLDDRFRLLPGGRRTALERHRTLRAMVDWSYERLGEPERRLFDRLAVFAGGWTLEAAEAVGAGDGLARADVLGALVRLVDTSLVLVDAARPAGPRYRLLETLRQYGRDRLAAGGRATAASERHAAYFLDLATTAAGALRGPQQVAALDRLEAEHENLRAALRWLAEAGAAGPGLRLAGALWRFWWTRGYWREGQEWLGRFLALPAAPPDAAARGAATAGRAVLLDYLGERAAARALHEEGLAAARARGDRAGAALALAGLGHLALYAGDFAAARRRARESLGLWRRAGDPTGTADALRDLALTAEFAERHDEARPLYQEALAIYARVGDDRGAARCLEGLANSLRAARRRDRRRALRGVPPPRPGGGGRPLDRLLPQRPAVARPRPGRLRHGRGAAQGGAGVLPAAGRPARARQRPPRLRRHRAGAGRAGAGPAPAGRGGGAARAGRTGRPPARGRRTGAAHRGPRPAAAGAGGRRRRLGGGPGDAPGAGRRLRPGGSPG